MAIVTAFLWVSLLLAEAPCTVIDTTITGDSLDGLLWDGQKISVHTPGCGRPSRYDFMLFTHPSRPNAIIKQIWGMPGDTLRIAQNGQVLINDVAAKTPFGKPYRVLRFAKKRLEKLSKKPLEGYLLLGHPGSEDSARFGLITDDVILGYVKRDKPYDGQVSPPK